MAADLVSSAVLSSFLSVAFDRLASQDVLEFFRRSEPDETLPKKLNIMLSSINTVIDDAEAKQFTDPNVKAWLDKVKDAVYDAEDVLGEIDYELTRREMETETQTTVKAWLACKVRNLLGASITSFDKDIQSRMKQVLESLEFLENRKIVLGLKQGTGGGRGVGSITRVQTTSLVVDETTICGRDDDKEMIINWLLSDSNHNESNFSVMSIVGMGGLGKTTLAQLVYNDQKTMKPKFDLKAWVCVSDEFDVLRVTRTIFEAITNSKDDSKDLNMLQNNLKEKLSKKKFLLVLDDVWNENYMLWETLQKPFHHGASGSKILVTTRSKKVASTMRSDKRHSLKLLTEEDSWRMFKRLAFGTTDVPRSYSDVQEVGRKISAKCKGLPLALKTIGSLLYTKLSSEQWNGILKSEIWNEETDTLPALRLSYHYLPSHLKRCFAYCSIYPKDYEFQKEELVQLWMAENIQEYGHQNKDILNVGEQFFHDLLSRSFFQQSTKGDKCFVMHDLINDLAKKVSQKFCFRLEIDDAQNLSEQTRHVSYLTRNYYYVSKRFEAIYKIKKLRTFLPLLENPNITRHLSTNVIDNLFSMCMLHFLSLAGFENIIELPESIGNLHHLRYLDLSGTGIRGLPNSVCRLYCLQTLKLWRCASLEVLPLDLHKLINLRYLDFRQTKVREIPKKLRNLRNLQVLSSFFVGKCSETNIQQLRDLDLQGTLSISELQHVRCPSDALAANLRNKRCLEGLRLEWCEEKDESQSERDVLEKLQPHKNLKRLSIINYGGTRFPDWFLDNTLFNPVSIELSNCKYCLSLPALGLLPCLKSLTIKGFDGVVVIGAEFYGTSSSGTPFGCLELLRLENMVELEEWKCDVFPRLKELYIEECPKLKEQLPAQLVCLKRLVIKQCKQLVGSAPSVPTIEELVLGDCGTLTLECGLSTLRYLQIDGPFSTECLPFEEIVKTIANSSCCLEEVCIKSCDSLKSFPLYLFPKLRSLKLEGCSNLESIICILEQHSDSIISLASLFIIKCPKFVSFQGFSAPKLQHLHIEEMENLVALPQNMRIMFPSLVFLLVRKCAKVESFCGGGLPSNLQFLHIGHCPKLVASRMGWGLHTLASLRKLIIKDVQEVCFPEAGLLPPTLTHLVLCYCSNLKELDYEALSCLSSLKKLHIVDCPKLQCFPKEGLPSSLSCLGIKGCPILEGRCQKEKGQDWEIIAHITEVIINDDVLT